MKTFYRAKSIETQEWVYGSAVACGDRAFIIQSNAAIFLHSESGHVISGIPVDPQTICRFLKQVNGVNYFENDIIFDRVLKMEGVICYDSRSARFVCKSKTNAFFVPYDLTLKGSIFDKLEQSEEETTKE